MVTVVKKKGENNEALFRRFGRLVVEEELPDQYREGLYYMRPSQERKEKEKNRGKKRRRHNN